MPYCCKQSVNDCTNNTCCSNLKQKDSSLCMEDTMLNYF